MVENTYVSTRLYVSSSYKLVVYCSKFRTRSIFSARLRLLITGGRHPMPSTLFRLCSEHLRLITPFVLHLPYLKFPLVNYIVIRKFLKKISTSLAKINPRRKIENFASKTVCLTKTSKNPKLNIKNSIIYS